MAAWFYFSQARSAKGGVDLDPREITATVIAIDGSNPVAMGSECRFAVGRRPRGRGYWCNAQIVCGGKLLYGGPTSGFFPCTLDSPPGRHVVGADPETTSVDTDAAMSINSQTNTLTVWDDATGPHGAYTMTAEIRTLR